MSESKLNAPFEVPLLCYSFIRSLFIFIYHITPNANTVLQIENIILPNGVKFSLFSITLHVSTLYYEYLNLLGQRNGE